MQYGGTEKGFFVTEDLSFNTKLNIIMPVGAIRHTVPILLIG